MTSTSVNRLFTSQARLVPEALALSSGDTRLTYGELERCANHLARRLVDSGVRPRDRVLLCLPRSVDAVIAMLAIMKTGAAFVPIDPAYSDAIKRGYASDSGARHALARAADAAAFRDGALGVIDADDLSAARDDEGPEVDAGHDGETPVYVMFTSGSTGRPKGVIVAHRGVARLVRETNYIRITREDTLLLLSPITFDASTFEIWGALLNGARLAIYEDATFDPNAVSRLIAREQVSVMWLTAGLFHLVARRFIGMLAGLRVVLAGGDVLSAAAIGAVFDAFPSITVINGYGPTENTTFTCCHVMTADRRPTGTVPIGRPIAGTDVRILDAALREVPDGEEGELCASGLGVALGYLNAPDATRAAFVDCPATGSRLYRTGDRARRRADGVIEFLGRSDRLVKIRGYRVSLDELQSVLAGIPGVEEALVKVSEEATGEKRLSAIVQSGRAEPDMKAYVRRELAQRVPPFQIPDDIRIFPHIPLNANGKLDRHRLPVSETSTLGEKP
ncbi:amino acid adenylation protein [Burkholderia pseudomallei]|uniref:amino acid adenylation domain-containing protein n=1 Tax=Burkholderia pseudomallei TaxID=28450 RepID=UPI0009787D3F|nr:amino acid adenylation domain-containing protein [Burkholderia pseudomallei]ONB59166.1 amino acid adenylation protein [Burkholderia pseudomallei]ONC01516.1 amino acid adenylation protein [Burkholderia pseudomallei]